MRARRSAFWLLPVITLGLLASCGGDDGGDSESSDAAGADAATLEGTDWVLDLTQVGVTDAAASGTLLLADGAASGTTGCNSFSGGYTLDGDDLSFGQLATTSMACEGELAEGERAVLDALAATSGYTVTGDTLELTGDDGTLLTYQAASATALAGSWDITGYLMTDGSAFTGVVAGTTPAVTFGDDGTVSGNAGCNQMTGTYTAGPGTLTVGTLGTTRKLCTEPEGAMDQEAAIVANLESAVTWTTTSGGIELANAEGTRVLTLAPAG